MAKKTTEEIEKEKKIAEHTRPKVTLITCTGSRHGCFKMLEASVKAQTFKNFEWLVVDDSTPGTPLNLGQKFIKGPIEWRPDINTQRANMEVALKHARGEFIFILEDDDYYAPTYLASMLSAFTHSDVVGISNSKYYKVDMPGWKTMKNYEHASLSQTAFRASLLPLMNWAVNSGEFYFDMKFWRAVVARQIPFTLIANSDLSIGMKGMPGRAGLTPGHRSNKGYMLDSDYSVIKKWLGTAGFSQYEPFLKKRNAVNNKEIKSDGGRISTDGKVLSNGREIRKVLSGRDLPNGKRELYYKQG